MYKNIALFCLFALLCACGPLPDTSQSGLFGEYPEAMAFGYDVWGRIDWPHELALNHIENPDRAFVDIIQQLEAL